MPEIVRTVEDEIFQQLRLNGTCYIENQVLVIKVTNHLDGKCPLCQKRGKLHDDIAMEVMRMCRDYALKTKMTVWLRLFGEELVWAFTST